MTDIAHTKPEAFSRWMARLAFDREQSGKRLRWWHRLLWIEWALEYVNHGMRNWALVEFLGHAARFTLLVSVILAANRYFFEADERRDVRHGQAWAVIAAAAGKSGDLGRKVALQSLAADGVSLKAAPLTGATLAAADLRGALLWDANLEGADLTNANLAGARFDRAHLAKARFNWANLDQAIFTAAHLEGADLGSAHLRAAHLLKADLSDASLVNANLAGANLIDATLARAGLRFANLQGADLTRADLTRANLDRANLDRANLDSANLRGATGLTSRQIQEACFDEVPPQLPDGLTAETMARC